jgi:hypothetical protein
MEPSTPLSTQHGYHTLALPTRNFPLLKDVLLLKVNVMFNEKLKHSMTFGLQKIAIPILIILVVWVFIS